MASNPTAADARAAAAASSVTEAMRELRAGRDHCLHMGATLLLVGEPTAALRWAEHAAVADARIGMLLDPRPEHVTPMPRCPTCGETGCPEAVK